MGLTFINSQLVQADSTIAQIDFVHGSGGVVFDGTYDEYLFTVVNYKPVTDSKALMFQVDTGTLTAYNQPITSTSFKAYSAESGSSGSLDYETEKDQGNGTDPQDLTHSGELGYFYISYLGYIHAMSCSGQLTLYDPSNATYVKHWKSRFNTCYSGNHLPGSTYTNDVLRAGYINTTTALTRVRFTADSGAIGCGRFTLYGVG